MSVNSAVRARARVVVAAAEARDDVDVVGAPVTAYAEEEEKPDAHLIDAQAHGDAGLWFRARLGVNSMGCPSRFTPFVRTYVLHTLRHALSVYDHKQACMHMRAASAETT